MAAAPVSDKPQIGLGLEGSDAAAIENNPSKLLLSHFVYKACLVTVFLVLAPLFPSLAPDFFNQTLHARSWEVLQLIFVGIAVSYGLFSKKNDNEPPQKDHNPQSYLSKLLQVSSVFDDDDESQSQSESETHTPTTIIQENNNTLNSSQYYRGQPPVVVVPKQEKNEGIVSEITQKPLLLPVRSLRKTENSAENDAVLPSPIPWRSRSGRLEMEEATGDASSSSPQLSNRIESRSFRSNNLSPSKSESPIRIRKKSVTAAPPPPPPPPPRKSMLMKSNSAISNDSDSREREMLRRSVSSVAEIEVPKRPNSESVRTFRSNGYVKEEEKNEVADKVFVESTDEDEDDDFNDDFMEAGKSNGRDDDGGPDVDKKADEFIAKFREQIRLQRIESIRRTTALRTTGNKLNSK